MKKIDVFVKIQAKCHLFHVIEKKINEYQLQIEQLEMDQANLQAKIKSHNQWLGQSIKEDLLKEPTLESQESDYKKAHCLQFYPMG